MKKLVVFVVVLIVTMGTVYTLFSWSDWGRETVQRVITELPLPSLRQKEKIDEENFLEATIFLPSAESRFLYADNRLIPPGLDPHELLSFLMEEILKGPEDGGASTIPEGTRLLNAYLDGRGGAYLDFSPELKQNHVHSTWAEALTVYSIVNTVAVNIDGVKRVYILIDGSVEDTLAGHLALSRPFSPRFEMAENRGS